jgi:RNA recognition motif-containing protein
MIQKRVAFEAIERQKRIKFFGQANEESNKGLTVIGSLTYIQYLDEKEQAEVKKPLTTFKINASATAYKPNINRVKHIDMDSVTKKTSGFVGGGYIPKNIKQQLEEDKNFEQISIVVKNFPTYAEMNVLKDIFRKYFTTYGEVKRITILTDKQNNIKDIAFIEFYYNKDALKVFEKPRRLIIEKYIVSITKQTKKRKKFI